MELVKDLHARFDSLQLQQSSLTDRLIDVENLQVQASSLRPDVEERWETAAIRRRAPCMVVYGLSEQAAADGVALRQAVDTQVVQAMQQYGLASDAILEVKRLGALKNDAHRPRPVLVRWRTPEDKHLAFKAWSALKAIGITLADFRTPAQSNARSAQMRALHQPVAALGPENQDLQVQASGLRPNAEDSLEAAAIHERAANMIVIGLAEEGAADGVALRQAVNEKVLQAAQQHGLASDAILEVKRLDLPSPDTRRPRPVLIRWRSPDDKHLAFKARTALRATGIILNDDLTPAQRDARRALQSACDRLRQEPGANAHFKGAQLHFWRNGQLVAYDAAQHAIPE